jgi:hypothetical protein
MFTLKKAQKKVSKRKKELMVTNTFISLLIIHTLWGVVFKEYIGLNAAYNQNFTLFMVAIIALLIVVDSYCLTQCKEQMNRMESMVKRYIKPSFLIVVINLLLTQLFIATLHRTFVHFL